MPPEPPAIAARPSLTERRKAETRKAIANVACDLFVRDGFDEVTVDSVAQEAGVSLRTFYRYFAGKEDVFTPMVSSTMADLAAGIAERPAEEDLGTAVRHAFAALVPDGEDANYRPMVSLMVGVPALRARWLDSLRSVEDLFVPVVAARTGDRLSELEVRLTAAAIVLSVRLAVESAIADGDAPAFSTALSQALDHLSAGAAL